MSDDNTKIVRLDEVMRQAVLNQEKLTACFIVIAGTQIGRMFKLEGKDYVVGRSITAAIQLDDDGVSRKHAEIRRTPDGVSVVDLGSTNGTWVNGRKIKELTLSDGDKIRIGTTTILKFSYQDPLEQDFQRRQYEMLTRDPLTSAYNRAYLMERLEAEWSFAQRHNKPLAVAMIDIDHFKHVNDSYGHPAGDFVLKLLVKVIQKTIRGDDLFARYGGEEFCLVMRETYPEQSLIATERIRQRIAATPFDWGDLPISITISIGVATSDGSQEKSWKELLKRADDMLFIAKRNGRNRTECRL